MLTIRLLAGASTIDMNKDKAYPMGADNPHKPNTKVKFLATEVLRGVDGLPLNNTRGSRASSRSAIMLLGRCGRTTRYAPSSQRNAEKDSH